MFNLGLCRYNKDAFWLASPNNFNNNANVREVNTSGWNNNNVNNSRGVRPFSDNILNNRYYIFDNI